MKQVPFTRRALAGCAVAALSVSAVLAADAAIGAEASSPISAVGVDAESVDAYALMTVALTWAFPDDAAPGDTVTVEFPEELLVAVPSFPVRSADGAVIAHADAESDRVTITLTDQAAGRVNRGGVLEVGARWKLLQIPESGVKELTFIAGGETFVDTVVLPPRVPRDRFLPLHWVRWTDASDQGTRVPEGATQFGFEAPAVRIDGPVEWTMTFPTDGHRIDCATVELQRGTHINEWSVLADAAPAPELVDANTCQQAQDAGESTFTLRTVPVEVGTIMQLRYQSDVLPEHGATLLSAGTVTVDAGTRTFSRTATAPFTAGDGNAAADGLQVKNVLVNDAEGDSSVAPGATVPADTDAATQITVTNVGADPLTDVSVYSVTHEGVSVQSIDCDFSAYGGPATGTTAATLPSGAAVTCTGSVPAMSSGDQHGHTVFATGTGATSTKDVLAGAPLFAVAAAPLEETEEPEAPVEPADPGAGTDDEGATGGDTAPSASGEGALAVTGAELAIPMLTVGVLALVGGVALAKTRRRADRTTD
jgi:hypothetical protein